MIVACIPKRRPERSIGVGGMSVPQQPAVELGPRSRLLPPLVVRPSWRLTPFRKVAYCAGNGLEYGHNRREKAMAKRIKRLETIEVVHPNAAGVDIGALELWACVPPDRAGETVQSFGTFTPDLKRLADWLVACGVETVAMESTGVYWIPTFELLEARGLK